MNLIFTKIKLHNFFSFSDTELILNDMGYTLVAGRNYCKLDSAYSNGSGKSSIFNGICFALTGETAQGVSNGVENIFSDPDDCWVELSFKADNDEFLLRRYKTPRPDLKIWINGEDKSGKGIRESSKLLATYLPDLNSTLINSIIILGQGLPNRFTNNNPAQRKEILEKLTKSDFMIQSIKDKLDIRQTELKNNLRLKEDGLLSVKSQLSVYNKQLSDMELELKEFEEFDNSEDNLDSKISSLQSELNDMVNILNNYSSELNNNSKELDLLVENNNTYIINSTNELNDLLTPIDEELTSATSELATIDADIKNLNKEIKKLDSITDICPTCGQKIPNINKPDTTVQKNNLNDLTNKRLTINNRIKELKDNKTDITNNYNITKTKNITTANTNITNLRTLIKNLTEKREQLNNKYIELSQTLLRLNTLKQTYTKLISDITTTTQKVDELNNNINEFTSDIIDINSHLDIVQQLITLAKREFRGILLINIIEYINKKVKQYSMEVFGTSELEFKLDENAIDISYCDKAYENLSGGEKQKIDVIVQLALRDVLSKQLNIHSNLLVADEIFDNLDAQGCSKIINLISNLTDIDSIFIISHHAQDLELTKDNEIVVEKNESGISSIKFV